MTVKVEREFPIETVLSISTGISLCNFGDMHECAEFLMGHSIWTHEFADRSLWERMKSAVFSQHPDLVDCNATGVTPENVRDRIAEYVAKYGQRRTLVEGHGRRTESPMESASRIMPGKPVLVAEVPSPSNN